jgi:hypothetical protein
VHFCKLRKSTVSYNKKILNDISFLGCDSMLLGQLSLLACLLDPCRWRQYNQQKMSGTTQPATKLHTPRRHQCEKLTSCNKILIISVVRTHDRTHLYSTLGDPKHNMTLSITWHKQIKYSSHKRDTEMAYAASTGVHQLTGYHLQYSSLLNISYILHGTKHSLPI